MLAHTGRRSRHLSSRVQQVLGHRPILRDYVKPTVGFEQLGEATGASPKNLIRMFGPSGNPQARNLFSVISHLQREAHLTQHVTARSH